MIRNNKELRRSLILLTVLTLLWTLAAFFHSLTAGVLMLLAGGSFLTAFLFTERSRYRKLQQISNDLDRLLTTGQNLCIGDYEEGELSVLAVQVEKLTLMLQEAAELRNREKELLADSLADISHQLRTPLTAMNLTAAMLRDRSLTHGERLRLIGELSRLLERTDWLVETLLKLSRLDAGTVRLEPTELPVRALLNRATEALLIPIELRGQQLVIRCGEEQVKADLTWTAEALGNILKNAMEHTPEGGCITVTVENTPLYTQLQVADTGPGFDRRDLAHLFERFYKGKNAWSNSCGIGLAFARTVITAQNGTVQASNGKSGGLFTVRFYHRGR